MTALRHTLVLVAALAIVGISAPSAGARSVGQVFDDTAITTEIKAKLTTEKLSNLTKIEVRTDNGIVTLNGVVDDPARRARAAQIASGVGGVKGIVNNIHVAGTTIHTDGTVVRVAPSAVLRRGADRLAIDQIVPGSEIVVRTAARVGPAEGSALPGQAVATTVDATEINVVWTPVSGVR